MNIYNMTVPVICIVALLTCCRGKEPGKYTGPVEKLTLAAYAGSYGFLPFIAQEKGFSKKTGLK